jgi:hypothetical protein
MPGPTRSGTIEAGTGMIVALHVATGAAAGAVAGSRGRAAAIGLLSHLACDVVPHEDIPSRLFETASGVACVLFLLRRRGLDAVTIGAVAASAPDLEHVLPLPRPRGRQLFPSHRWSRPHPVRGVPAWVQLVAAGALLARVGARA